MKPTLRARELAWRKTVQRRRRQEARATTHAAKQEIRVARRRAERALARVREQIKAANKPMRLRALEVAQGLVGVVEQGGNNAGPMVNKIIRENGGTGPEPWCGDFVAWCYRRAGSRMVTRGWAAVRILGWLTGMRVVSTPVAGAIVIFNFSHTGLVEKVLSAGQIQTIEGNTGSSGAVSDSQSGTDGVKRKVRSTGLVVRYVIPTR